MTMLESIFFGVLQGILEFLPVSSFGHLVFAEQYQDLPVQAGVFFEALLHLGSMTAVLIVFWSDIQRIVLEFAGIINDLFTNLLMLIRSRFQKGYKPGYRKIISNIYRKMTVLLIVTMIPTGLLGFTVRRLVLVARKSSIAPGMFLLLTGVFLIVSDLSKAGGVVTPAYTRYDHALWIGICQGVSAFPGMSRCAFTLGTAFFCGFDRRYAVKYSYLAALPAIAGAFFVELPEVIRYSPGSSQIGIWLMGMVAAAVSGCFMIRWMMKWLHKIRFRWFAVYCFAAGAAVLFLNYR